MRKEKFCQQMKKIGLIFCFLVCYHCLKAQDTTVFHSYMDDFNRSFALCLEAQDDSVKIKNAAKAADIMEKALREKGAFGYNFYKSKNLSSAVSPDRKLRTLTFGVSLNSGEYAYYGFLMYSNGKTFRTTRLTDGGRTGENLNLADMQADNWFGAVYYEICQFGSSKRPVYALCGWDGADMYINRKVVEQVVVDEYGKPRFGGSFQTENSAGNTRLVFCYTERVVMSLSFDKKLGMIVADHLNAPPQYKENPRFYGPDMTFDGYFYDNGKWRYLPDVDAKLNGKKK